MRIVFMGTPPFAATILENLLQHHNVVGVYTRPDAVRGRGRHPKPSAVAKMAETYGIEVNKCTTLKDEAVQQKLARYAPDVICVAAFGAILPAALLDSARWGCLNVHASLLPRWRGAAPIERAILAGDAQTGVCVMRMEEGLDTGDFCACRAIPIAGLRAPELSFELALLGSRALLTALMQLEQGTCKWVKQDNAQATYAKKIEKGELNLSVYDTAETLCRKVQASSEAHPARCVVAGRRVTIEALSVVSEALGDAAFVGDFDMRAGEVRFAAKRLLFGAREGVVEVLQIKPDGKKSMDAKAFAAGVQGIKTGCVVWENLYE